MIRTRLEKKSPIDPINYTSKYVCPHS